MRAPIFYLLGLSLVLVGCQNKNQESTMRSEEPYAPTYTSLDSMDTASGSGAFAQSEATEDSFARAPVDFSGAGTDEVLDPAGGSTYTVQKGDTLYKLARRFYNDQARWHDIWSANRAQIPDPNLLRVGTQLIIP